MRARRPTTALTIARSTAAGVAVLALLCAAWLYLSDVPAPEGEPAPVGLPARGVPAERPVPAWGAETRGSSLQPESLGRRSGGSWGPDFDVVAAAVGPEAVIARVVDGRSGQPVKSFAVHVVEHDDTDVWRRVDGRRPRPFRSTTGAFQIGAAPGLYDVVVRAEGFAPALLERLLVPATADAPPEIALRPATGLAGLASTIDGKPLTDVPVHLHVLHVDDAAGATPAAGEAPPSSVAWTDGRGRFWFAALPAGRYAVSLIERDNVVDRSRAVAVDGPPGEVDLTLRPRRRLEVVVLDAQEEWVGAADVILRRADGSIAGRTTTSDRGYAVLQHVRAGRYTLSVERAGLGRSTTIVSVPEGAGKEVCRLKLEGIEPAT